MTIFRPAAITPEQAAAIKAVAKGNASPDQQKTALLWIMDDACGTWMDAIQPGHPDVTAYLTGRKSVALQISTVLRSRAPDPTKKETK